MQPNKFGVHIKCKDFEKSLKFYLDFGFQPVFAYGDENHLAKFKNLVGKAPEKYKGVTFDIGGAIFELGEKHPAVKPVVFQENIGSSKVSAILDVDSLVEVREICEKNDYEIAKPETDYPWGTRELVVRDPDGFILVFREKYY